MSATVNCQSMHTPIRRVLLKHARDAFRSQEAVSRQWRDLHYLDCPDYARAVEQYDGLVELLQQAGIEVDFLAADPDTSLDSIYACDPVIVSSRGAVLCRMGKPQRQPEPAAVGRHLEEHGIPVLGTISGHGRLEGGDVLWLDQRTVVVGKGYRSNAEGARQLRELLGNLVDELITVPLPHWNGPDDCFHLLSMIHLVDRDLAVARSPLMPVPFRQMLLERGIQLLEVPQSEWESLGWNVLAVEPRRCLMLSGNPRTQKLLEKAGAEVRTFDGSEISVKGCGGPTCLTRPLLRDAEG